MVYVVHDIWVTVIRGYNAIDKAEFEARIWSWSEQISIIKMCDAQIENHMPTADYKEIVVLTEFSTEKLGTSIDRLKKFGTLLLQELHNENKVHAIRHIILEFCCKNPRKYKRQV